jgi:uncharacterized protein YecT (DUF1311 family)
MYWRYAPVILICLLSFAYASEEAVDNAASSTPLELTGHVTKKPKKVKPRAATNGACEYTGNSKEDVACSYEKYLFVEAQLNTRYEQLLAELDKITEKNPRLAELKPKLLSAQQAWIAYRESQCRAVEVWYTNGKLQDALYTDCMRSLGEKRIEELNSFTSNQT